jgi:hypothetical protein
MLCTHHENWTGDDSRGCGIVGRELASVTEIEQIKMKIHDYISKHT